MSYESNFKKRMLDNLYLALFLAVIFGIIYLIDYVFGFNWFNTTDCFYFHQF